MVGSSTNAVGSLRSGPLTPCSHSFSVCSEMQREPEYAQSRYQKLHRGGSLILVVASLLVNLVLADGFDWPNMRIHAAMIFPLVLIWSPDLLAANTIEASGGWFSARNADVAIRVGGWFFLLLLLAVGNFFR